MPVTPRSAIVSRQRSQRTGRAIWPTIRLSTSRPSWTTLPSRLEMNAGARVVHRDRPRPAPATCSTAGAMCGVWKAPATESGRSLRLGGRVGGERLELLEGAGGDDLAGAVVVGGGQAVPLERGEHLVAVAAEDGGHAGGGGGGGVGHRPAALADQHHRLLGADHPGAGRGRDLAHAVAGDGAELGVGVGRVREQRERRDQAGGDEQRLGDPGVPDRRPRRPRCRSGRGRCRRRSTASRSARRTSGPPTRVGGSRGSVPPVRGPR